MFKTVLVANRGEIAVRLVRACGELGIRAVAVYSEADVHALHVELADAAERLGPAPAAESYLSFEAVLAAAERSGAEAIHPGYGFLAENADFADACIAQGLVWIGPPPDAMRKLGDKAAARALAERLGVPVARGYHGEAQDEATLREEAASIGFPLLIKAAAGGGGRGMRVVRTADELDEELASARREAQAAFGSDRVILEQLVERPRHVEVQVLGDLHGNLVHLGERDCSIQRRHQKLVEESPAPHVDQETRRRMGEAALSLARAVGYASAGTAEFLVDETGRFCFLEMNTRLQVEHPVTEVVTGLDLARWQLRIAAGERLGFGQEDVRLRGHAIELRIVAEDPSRGFLPWTGSLPPTFVLPAGPNVRVDAGYRAGSQVSPFYDSLLAKLIVWGEDRSAALGSARRVLDEIRIGWLTTNVQLLRAIAVHPVFVAGQARTDFLERDLRPEEALAPARQPVPPEAWVAAATVIVGADDRAHRKFGPWRSAWAWRMGGQGLTFALKCGEQREIVRVWRDASDWSVELGGQQWRAELPNAAASRPVVLVRRGGNTTAFRWRPDNPSEYGRDAVLEQDGQEWLVHTMPLLQPAASTGHVVEDEQWVDAPMPGKVVRVAVAAGERVKAGQVLVVLEAMKIEHRLVAPREATVKAVHTREGQQVEIGTRLVELEVT